MNTLFPLFVKLEGKPCIVIGGGMVAFRKILGLLECRAAVQVISRSCVPQIVELHAEEQIVLLNRAYRQNDVANAFLVVAATDNAEVNAQIYQECTAGNLLCNVVDQPELCNFYYASTYTCGDLKIAISTNGTSPTLAKKIKAELAECYPEEFSPYLEYLRRIRETVKEKISEESTRHTLLKKIATDSNLLEQCKDERFRRQIANLDYAREVDKWL